MKHAFLVLLAASTLLAGCLTTPDVGPKGAVDDPKAFAADWWEHAIPSSITVDNHEHNNRSHHAGITTPNFATIGWDPLETETFGASLTGMGCGGAVTRADGRRLAVVHSIATTVSFVVADITDAAQPQMLGEYYLPNAVVWDADISADGNHVLIGAYPPGPIFGRDPSLPIPPTTGPAWARGHTGMVLYRDACSGAVVELGPLHYLPGPAIVMVGIHDPSMPEFEQYVPQPVIGPHSVGSQEIDGVVYATSSVTNLVHKASYYTVFEIVDTPAGGVLETRWAFETPGDPPLEAFNGHTDVFLHKHPKTGQLLGHLANWNGYYIWDLSGPIALPLSEWMDGDAGNVHTTYPFPFLRDGRQYIAVGQEVDEPRELPSGWIYLLDITDPTKPTEVSRWTLPVKPKWDDKGLQFSPHYVAVLNHTMFVANYHGGLWAVDITDLAKPEAIGIFVPDRDAPNAYGNGAYGPSIEDVIVDPTTGLLTTWDNAGGVYQLTFDATMEAPRAPAWQTE
jgi:hypothetical protein